MRAADPADAATRLAAVAEFRDDGVDLAPLGATVTLDAAGRVELAVSRHRASTERCVGWHGWVAQRPVSGIRRLDPSERPESRDYGDAVETRT